MLRETVWDWSRPYWVGVVNVTPDSFSDGGEFEKVHDALRHGAQLIEDGADLLDVGGESTRPTGAVSVSAKEEISRVVPVIEGIRRSFSTPISVDTTKSEVAEAAIEAGADVVNDISGGLFDPLMAGVCADAGVAYVCGHVRGNSLSEVHSAPVPSFDELVQELGLRVASLPESLRTRTIVDPGVGFGKDTEANLIICSRIGELRDAVQCPTMVGVSRKRFLGDLTGRPAPQRDDEKVGASLAVIDRGAQLVRVHSVAALRSAYIAYSSSLRGVK